MIEEGEIYKYFRILNRIIPKGSLIVDTFGNTDVFICVTENSYYIFDLKKLDILFIGPLLPPIGTYSFYGDVLCISNGNQIKKYQRANCVGEIEMEKEVKQILCVGNIMFVVDTSGGCTLVEDKEVNSREGGEDKEGNREGNNIGNSIGNNIEETKHNNIHIPFTTQIEFIHHPHAYLNKLILVTKDFSILYNFRKFKEVYKFKSLKSGICVIEDSNVIDIVGVGYCDGTVDVVDLKKDKVLFSFNSIRSCTIKEISFGEDKMVVVGDNSLFVFDLETKRLILKRKDALSCKFVGNNYILLSSSTSIGLFEIRKETLEKIKSKESLVNNIIGIEEGEENEFLIFSKLEFFKYNTGNTFNYQKYKFKGEIEKHSFKGGVGVVYGNKVLYRVNNSIKYVLNEEISFVTTYKNICCLITENIVFLNLDSLRIYATIKKDLEVNAIEIDRENLYVLSEGRLAIIPYRDKVCNSLSEAFNNCFVVGNYNSLKLFNNLIALFSPTRISLFANGKVFRTFTVQNLSIPLENIKDFSISPNSKWIVFVTDTLIVLYDILSANKIETIRINAKFARFSQDNLFLIVVSQQDEIILLNNKLEFNPKKIVEDKSTLKGPLKEGFLKFSKKNLNLYNEILQDKVFKRSESLNINLLKKEDLERILKLLLDSLNLDTLEKHSLLINRILKHKEIEKKDFEEIEKKYNEIFKEFEEDYLKSVGYLELEKERIV